MIVTKLPPIAQQSFDPKKAYNENVLLDSESQMPAKRKGEDEVRVRALDHFLFERNGQFVYPTAGKTESWWKGVVVYGYAAVPAGPSKFLTWAGQWDFECDEPVHFELRRLTNIVDLTKEAHPHWRAG
ncbi:hypothetical protein FRC09_002285 [Ceratobasidium sp. 395]|nr:hypothetical protein FRC09_002285 [Ceratobasidium sp. 395]